MNRPQLEALPHCGLLVGDRPVPLQGVDVEVSIVAGQARVTVAQSWRNDEDKPVEAVYVFPLPPAAAVTGLRVTCGDEQTEAEIDEREAAFARYDQAVLAGHGAALLEQERADVFTLSLANLLPGETTTVQIRFVQPLLADEGALRWVLPTAVAPRYMPGAVGGHRTGHGQAEPTDRVTDADRISPPIGDAPYRLTLRGMVQLGCDVTVSSPSHSLVVQRGEGGGSFALSGGPLDRDLIVDVAGIAGSPAGVVVQGPRDDKPGLVAATLVPDLGFGTRTPLDVVFVLDRSGSMAGTAMVAARKALRLCLRHLRDGDRFGVVAFDDRCDLLASKLQPLGEKTLAQADRWIAGIDARGGTELLQALQAALNLCPTGLVVLLTDGQIGNEDEVLREIVPRAHKARIYSIGIGEAVSDALLAELGRQTGGDLERVHPDEGLDGKVIALFAKVTAARVTQVKAVWAGVEVDEQAPAQAPDLVDGLPWVLSGRWQSGGTGELVVTGQGPNGPFEHRLPVNLDRAADPVPGLAETWAGRRISELEALRVIGRRAGTVRNEIVKISQDYGVLSKHTSFVLVQKRHGDRRARGMPELRVVPVSAPHGWQLPQQVNAARTGMHLAVTMAGMAPGGGAVRAMNLSSAPSPAMLLADVLNCAAPSALPPPPRATSALRRAFTALTSKFADAQPAERVLPAPPPPQSYDACEESDCDDQGSLGGDHLESLLFRQRADGLWGSEHDELAATAAALGQLADGGVTTAHPLHGAPVKKAIEALCARAEAGARGPDLRLALEAALRAAAGARTKARVQAALKLVGG